LEASVEFGELLLGGAKVGAGMFQGGVAAGGALIGVARVLPSLLELLLSGLGPGGGFLTIALGGGELFAEVGELALELPGVVGGVGGCLGDALVGGGELLAEVGELTLELPGVVGDVGGCLGDALVGGGEVGFEFGGAGVGVVEFGGLFMEGAASGVDEAGEFGDLARGGLGPGLGGGDLLVEGGAVVVELPGELFEFPAVVAGL